MNIEQVIELVEKWLADPSSVTVEELDAAGAAAYTAWSAAAWTAWTAADAAYVACAAAAYWAADAAWAAAYSAANAVDADAAKYVAKYRKLTKQG